MGTVYEAADERLGIAVALKHNHFDDERLAKQFEREAHILAKLRHQALPRVMDHFQDAGGQFLIMEFVGGPDLARAVELRGRPFEAQMRAAMRAATPAPAAFIVPPTIAEVRDTQSATAPEPDREAAPTMAPAPPASPASKSAPPIAVSTIALDPVGQPASAGSATDAPLAP